MWRDDEELEPILDSDESDVASTAPGQPTARSGWRRSLLTATVALALLGLGGAGGQWLGRGNPSEPKRVDADLAETTTPSTEVPDDAVPQPSGWTDQLGFVVGAGSAFLGSTGPPGSLELIGTRTTPDGVSIRSYRPKVVADSQCGDTDWCRPPECQARAGLVHAMSTSAAIGFASSQRRPAVVEPPIYVSSWGVFGNAESAPVLFATIVAPARTHRLVLSLDGHVDTVGPVDGEAVLAVPLSAKRLRSQAGEGGEVLYDWQVAGVDVLARDGDGREIGRVALAAEGEGDGLPLPAQCEHPAPPLPAPGADQPVDPEWAREQVRRAYSSFWSTGLSRSEKLAWLTDDHGVEQAMAKAAENYARATSTTTVEVGDIVFTSPVQAQLHFRLVYSGAPSLGHRIGQAAFVDGSWKVSRTTVCEILSVAGASCTTG